MTATGWAWLAAAGILAVLDWVAVVQDARPLERVVKPLVLLAILLAAVAAEPIRPDVQRWLVLALACGLAGDLALVAERRTPVPVPTGRDAPRRPRLALTAPDERGGAFFLVGLLAFLLGHLSYLKAMLSYGTDRLSVAFGLALVLIVLLSFGYRVIAGAHLLGGGRLTVGVVLYVVALGSVVILGVGTAQLWIAGGVVLFAASDLLLAYDRFVQARAGAPVAVMITYHLGQALLLVGLVS